jgi:RNA polymerase sigma-70 factor, ECF subfamily
VSTPSFDLLYKEWFSAVSGWVRALGAPESDREDIVQEVFLVVLRRLADFDGQNAAGWLFQIARRKVRDRRRLVWVEHYFGRKTVPVTDEVLTTNWGPVDDLQTERQRRHFNRIIGELNEKQRATFVLFEIEGRRGTEIAEMLGVPVNTVWLRLHKARKTLVERGSKPQSSVRQSRSHERSGSAGNLAGQGPLLAFRNPGHRPRELDPPRAQNRARSTAVASA